MEMDKISNVIYTLEMYNIRGFNDTTLRTVFNIDMDLIKEQYHIPKDAFVWSWFYNDIIFKKLLVDSFSYLSDIFIVA